MKRCVFRFCFPFLILGQFQYSKVANNIFPWTLCKLPTWCPTSPESFSMYSLWTSPHNTLPDWEGTWHSAAISSSEAHSHAPMIPITSSLTKSSTSETGTVSCHVHLNLLILDLSWPGHFWRLASYSEDCLFIWIIWLCLMIRFSIFGRNVTGVTLKFFPLFPIRQRAVLICLMTGDVYLGHLIKMMSSRILTVSYSVFLCNKYFVAQFFETK